jgi:hypothetical protein
MKTSKYTEVLLGRFPNKTVIKLNGEEIEVIGMRYDKLNQNSIIEPLLSCKDKKSGDFLGTFKYSEFSVSINLVPVPVFVLKDHLTVFVQDKRNGRLLQKKVDLSKSGIIHMNKDIDSERYVQYTYSEYFLYDPFDIFPEENLITEEVEKENRKYIYLEDRIILR